MATVEQIAGVLAEHERRGRSCTCIWRPVMYLNDTESDRLQHRQHQAEQIAALDGTTSTEWGVLYEADRDLVIHEALPNESEARACVAASPTDTSLASRQVTEWRAAE